MVRVIRILSVSISNETRETFQSKSEKNKMENENALFKKKKKKDPQLYKQLHELGTRDFTKVKLSVKLLDLFTTFCILY